MIYEWKKRNYCSNSKVLKIENKKTKKKDFLKMAHELMQSEKKETTQGSE